ncbi:MAG TPA: hypothetical protein VM925_16225 [Labilithrix sp.]|nr:hypothetical protein [Labilithrix sp.]
MSGFLLDVSAEGFKTQSDIGTNAISVKLIGNADMDVLEAMGAFVQELHELAVRNGVATVVVDIRDLYFMNSYCLRQIVGWLTSLSEMSPEARYTIRFLTNQNLPWQKRSLASLKHLAEGSIEIV